MGFPVNHAHSGRWTMCRPAENTSRIKRFAMIILGTIALSDFANAHTADEAQALVERALAAMARVLLAGLLAVALFTAAAKPVCAGSPEEVQALVERAADYIHVRGRMQAFADFSRPDGGFVDGDLYVFCDDAAGINLANGGNPNLVGRNLAAVRDPDGKLPALDLYHMTQTKGQGWYDFLWPNPATGRVERKVVFAVRIDDQTFCASGYYKPDQP